MLFYAAGFEIHPGGVHNPSAFCYQDKSVWCLVPTCSVAAAGAKVRVSTATSIHGVMPPEAFQQPPCVCTLKQSSSGWLECSPASFWKDCCPPHGTCNYTGSETSTTAVFSPQKYVVWSAMSKTRARMRACSHKALQLANSALLVHGVGMQILILPRYIQGFLGVFCYCTVDILWAVPPLNDLSPLMTRWKGFIQVWFMILDKKISEFRSTATAASFWLVLTEDPSPEVRADKDYRNFWELGLQRLCQPPGQ